VTRSAVDAESRSDPWSSCVVVRNEEGYYAIWPDALDIPEGWIETGVAGPKETCLAWIEEQWEGP
jgi:MbtH protein